jgi:hypothetical protein
VAEFEQLIGLWEEGQRRIDDVEPRDRPSVERVIEELVLELRRRLGGPFTTDELAGFFLKQGTDWCFDIAIETAPGTPAAWDMTTVAGAAFWRYVRQASDYGGGRRRLADDDT